MVFTPSKNGDRKVRKACNPLIKCFLSSPPPVYCGTHSRTDLLLAVLSRPYDFEELAKAKQLAYVFPYKKSLRHKCDGKKKSNGSASILSFYFSAPVIILSTPPPPTTPGQTGQRALAAGSS